MDEMKLVEHVGEKLTE